MLLRCYLWLNIHIFNRGVLMKRSKKDMAKKFAEELQIPESAIHKTFSIEFRSDTDVTIEGCMGMVEYSDRLIAINLGNRIVRFHGDDMEISTFFESQAVIKGTILSMEFA